MGLYAPNAPSGLISAGNSTDTPLLGGATFTGTAEESPHPDMMVTLKCDSNCTLWVDLSIDGGSNYDTTIPFTVASGVGEFHTIVKGTRACRVRLVNGSDTQTYLRLQTEFGAFRQANKSLQSNVYQDDDAVIVRPVEWYQSVREGHWPDYSMLTKFGRNADIDTGTDPEDLWEGGGEYRGQPESFTPETVDVFSSSVDDASAGTGARTVQLEGLKTSTSQAYETEDIILNGTTAVTSASTWWRVNRTSVLTAGSGLENAGIITVRSTTTTANVFSQVPAGLNQSQIAAWTVPTGCTAYIKRTRISMARSSGAAGSAQVSVRCRVPGGVFNAIRIYELTTSSSVGYHSLGGPVLVAGTDVKVRVESVSDNNTVAEAALEFLIVRN